MSSLQHLTSTTIPPGKNRFSSDHRSQVWLREVSTRMGDRLGILRFVDFPFFIPRKILGKKLKIKDLWVKNEQIPISYVYDHTTRKNQFSSDHRSQVWLGEVSTRMGERLGILRVVDFAFSYATQNLTRKN